MAKAKIKTDGLTVSVTNKDEVWADLQETFDHLRAQSLKKKKK